MPNVAWMNEIKYAMTMHNATTLRPKRRERFSQGFQRHDFVLNGNWTHLGWGDCHVTCIMFSFYYLLCHFL
jgi:hypothetical protein